jgi:hypothetical protein
MVTKLKTQSGESRSALTMTMGPMGGCSHTIPYIDSAANLDATR